VRGGVNAATCFRNALIATDEKGSFDTPSRPCGSRPSIATASPLAVGDHQCCIDAPTIALPADRLPGRLMGYWMRFRVVLSMVGLAPQFSDDMASGLAHA
jgi:hypothetical protein